MTTKVKVTITTVDGEILDQFIVADRAPSADPYVPCNEIELADGVRDTLEWSTFEVEDPSL